MSNVSDAKKRESLKRNLAILPDRCHDVFKLMYGRNGGKRSVYDAIIMDISEVVDEMECRDLDTAMEQVRNTFILRVTS